MLSTTRLVASVESWRLETARQLAADRLDDAIGGRREPANRGRQRPHVIGDVVDDALGCIGGIVGGLRPPASPLISSTTRLVASVES